MTRLLTHPRALTLVLVCALGAALVTYVTCKDPDCSSPFQWVARAKDDRPVEPGTYEVAITLAEEVFTLTCDVAQQMQDSVCTDLEDVPGAGGYAVSFGLLAADDCDANPDDPVGGFALAAAHTGAGGLRGLCTNRCGPAVVAVEIVGEHGTLIDETYEVRYAGAQTEVRVASW